MDQYQQLLSIANYNRALLVGNAAVASILYPLLVYLIFWRTPRETSRAVKYNIFNVATTAYVHGIVFAIWQPVPLFPYMGGFSFGPFRQISDDGVIFLMYKVTLMLKFNLSLSYMMAFMHHYAILKPTSLVNQWIVSDWRRFLLFYIVYSLTLDFLIFILIDSMRADREMAFSLTLVSLAERNSTSVRDLITIVHKKEPTLAGYQISSPITIFYLSMLMVLVSAEANTIISMNLKIIAQIRTTKSMVQSTTLKLQMMVYRAFLMTTLSLLLFNFLPFGVIVMTVVGWIPSFSLAIAMYALISLLAPVSLFNILWTIRPYRRSALRLLLPCKIFQSGGEMPGKVNTTHCGSTEARDTQHPLSLVK